MGKKTKEVSALAKFMGKMEGETRGNLGVAEMKTINTKTDKLGILKVKFSIRENNRGESILTGRSEQLCLRTRAG